MDPDLLTPTRIASGAAPDLARRDASDTLGLRDKAHGHQVRDDLLHDLRDLRTRLWAEHRDEAIAETSTGSARWHVVPADRRWVRDAVVVT